MSSTDEQQLLQRIQTEPDLLLFIFTPFCGTCKLAGQMLDIVSATYPDFKIERIDIQTIPRCRERWRIESVPCLLGFTRGERVVTMYAFHSVTHLAEQLQATFGRVGGD
jgi:thioredoxin 1